jgi:hypothetical protein
MQGIREAEEAASCQPPRATAWKLSIDGRVQVPIVRRHDHPLALELFSGGVPAGALFKMAMDELFQFFANTQSDRQRTMFAVSYVGMVSYFEAMCKDQLASIINIYPSIIKHLREANFDTSIDAFRIASGSNLTLGAHA